MVTGSAMPHLEYLYQALFDVLLVACLILELTFLEIGLESISNI